MKQLLEHIKQELIARCKACIEEDSQLHKAWNATSSFSVKKSALMHFLQGFECFTQLFDTEEEVLEWLEDERLI